ncbi:MAG: DUF2442 domain-containing protein [Clostridia bacterium]|nr:DUF2442 domain-containing protein [Clostridia bacterium]
MIPPRISNAKALDNFNIEITYVNGEKKIYDMSKFLKHPAYIKLKNKLYFDLVKSAETTIEWPDGEDVDPNELYNNSISIK